MFIVCHNYVLGNALCRQDLPDQALDALDQVGGGVMRRPLDRETPCTNGAPSARFSLRGNVITTFLLHAQRLDSNIVFVIRLNCELEVEIHIPSLNNQNLCCILKFLVKLYLKYNTLQYISYSYD